MCPVLRSRGDLYEYGIRRIPRFGRIRDLFLTFWKTSFFPFGEMPRKFDDRMIDSSARERERERRFEKSKTGFRTQGLRSQIKREAR